MRSFDYSSLPDDFFTPDIMNLISAIHEHRGQQSALLASKPEILQTMLEIAKIQSTGASNRIEGIRTTDERLEALVMAGAEPQNRSECEIAGYREVLNLIHDNYEYMTPRPNLILQLHRDMYRYLPLNSAGVYKNSDNRIEETDPLGNRAVRFQPVSAFETPDAMERLTSGFLDSIQKERYDPLLLIPMFILDFLCIHPFNDGNGRLSRLLTLLLLYRTGYFVGKYISIESIVERTKDAYYDALKQSSIGWRSMENSYLPFVRYYLGVVLEANREFSNRVGHLAGRKISKPERIKKLFGETLGRLTKRDIRAKCPDISISTIESALADMLKEGYIVKTGAGKNTGYIKNIQ